MELRKGKRVRTVAQLITLANRRKSVIVPKCTGYRNPVPASWVQNWQGRSLYFAMKEGIFEYVRKAQKGAQQ
jgi:hypothetical protein